MPVLFPQLNALCVNAGCRCSKMHLVCIIIVIFVTNFASPQFNGDFWWLNDKVKIIQGKKAPPAQFEELTGLETDEGDKVVYKSLDSSDESTTKSTGELNLKEKRTFNIPIVELHIPDWNRFLWPSGSKNSQLEGVRPTVNNNTSADTNTQDEFSLTFPVEENFFWLNEKHNSKKNISSSTATPLQDVVFSTDTHSEFQKEHSDKLSFYHTDDKTESICSYINEVECHRLNGSVYKKNQRSENNSEFCCILPLEGRHTSARIVFPKEVTQSIPKRFPRSLTDGQKALNQRTAIERNKKKRIITPEDDYSDPYENIRSYRQRKPEKQVFTYPHQETDYDDEDDDDEEYADELPRPGMVGLYSESGQKPSNWPLGSIASNGESVLIEDTGYGVPNIHSRLDDRTSIINNRPPRRKPIKSTSIHPTYEKGVERISYQSKPDFQVLQGFKLLNLVKNRSRINNKQSKIVTEGRPILDAPVDFDDDFEHSHRHVYEDCGSVNEEVSEEYIYDDSPEEIQKEGHPWLAVVIRKQQQRRSMCYATLVHPRAAVTVASCVSGRSSPGDIVVYAGDFDLSAGRSKAQRRVASIYVHPKHLDDTNDIALLHWTRPFKMSSSVKAVCLDRAKSGETCVFVGYGEGQGLRRRPHKQQATVLPPHEYVSQSRSFCASIDGNFVAGTGAGLWCRRGARWAAVGVAVRRDQGTILLVPLQQWTLDALQTLGIA